MRLNSWFNWGEMKCGLHLWIYSFWGWWEVVLHFFITLRRLWSAFQDKLLEEMWKQQDSLEGPTATAAERPASPEAGGGGGGGSEENSKDSNPLLERLRALEVKWIAWSTSYLSSALFLFTVSSPFSPEMKDWSIHWEYNMFYLIKCLSPDIEGD